MSFKKVCGNVSLVFLVFRYQIIIELLHVTSTKQEVFVAIVTAAGVLLPSLQMQPLLK